MLPLKKKTLQPFRGANAEGSTVGKAMRNLQAHVSESRHAALRGKGWMDM